MGTDGTGFLTGIGLLDSKRLTKPSFPEAC
jgi:hypothetical protein